MGVQLLLELFFLFIFFSSGYNSNSKEIFSFMHISQKGVDEMENYVDGMKTFLNSEAVDTSKIPYKRILAVGDIHGHFSEFMTLYKKLNVSEDDLLILLGDLIEGGNENLSMIRWAMTENKKPNVIVLMGNAEDNFLHKPKKTFLSEELKEPELVAQVIKFMKNMPTHYHIEETFFFCHAGINSKKPLNKQSKNRLLNSSKKFAKKYFGKTLVVVGHTPVRKINESSTVPVKFPDRNVLFLDTEIKRGGRISCVDVLSGQYWQSDKIKRRTIAFLYNRDGEITE